MAVVLIPIAITALAAGASVAIGATTIAAAVLTVATTAALAGASYLLAGKASAGALVGYSQPLLAAPANYQRNITTQQAAPPRRYIYGTVRVGGSLLFRDNANPYLYSVYGLSDGVIESVPRIYFGDTDAVFAANGEATDATIYEGSLKVRARLGGAGQLADVLALEGFPDLGADWRQRGVATLVIRQDWGADAANHSLLWGGGVSPTIEVRGVKCYDPRKAGHVITNSATWAYTENPAICFAHALANMWDLKLTNPATDIDFTSVAAAADACDALLNGEATFRLSGVFQSGHDLAPQLSAMLRSFGGAIVLDEGVYRIYADGPRASILTLTDDDILELGDYQHEGETAFAPTAIKAMYFDAENEGTRVSSPIFIDASAATEGYREAVIDLPFTPNVQSARLLAHRELRRARIGRELVIHVTDLAAYCLPHEVLTVASDDFEMINGLYEIVDVDPAEIGVNLRLRAYSADIYGTAFLAA